MHSGFFHYKTAVISACCLPAQTALVFPAVVFCALKDFTGVLNALCGRRIRIFKNIINSQILVFHCAKSVVRKNLYALNVAQRPYKITSLDKIFIIVGNSRNKNVAYPDRFIDFIKIAEPVSYTHLTLPTKA